MQTEAQKRYGIRRTLVNRLDKQGYYWAARAVETGAIQVPGAEISNRKESK